MTDGLNSHWSAGLKSKAAGAWRDVRQHFGCYMGYAACAIAMPGLIAADNWHAAGWCCLALFWNILAHRTGQDFYMMADIAERALDGQERVLNFNYEEAMKVAKQYGLPTRFPL